ncbi:hypothetical protein [Thermomonas sp. HDW16]|uniref:hypothetical protein n=1 Tax=Thermomonas sp. HDW16 TaxID=2714945 RepID=UPI001407F0FF|nr:hypothetical protein [Thermomonas sp. HDW16]QIL19948.1 hypothetical protein G7079_03935 [Thermomonas sp. HDW16]
MLRFLAIASLLLACACWPRTADAQVRQCIASDGSLVYTDRQCADIGGTERPASQAAVGISGQRLYRGGCSRSVQDLVYSLSSAIQSGDANQIAGVYDWAGMSTGNAYRLMSRLEAIAKRPLVDVQPMYAGGTNEYGYAVVEFDADTGAVVSKPPRKPHLIGLRVEQTLGNNSTPSRTVFALRKNLGCWWVRL